MRRIRYGTVSRQGHRGRRRRAGLTDEALREYCAGRLAKFKIPKIFRFVEELPRTASGKVLKGELRRMHRSEDDSTQGEGRAAP